MNAAASYPEYLEARGYHASMPVLRMIRRMFLGCWWEPGFHNFWRAWNPVAGFFLYRLYHLLGGCQNRTLAVVASFLFSGFVFHDFPLMLLLQRPIIVCTSAWLFFALATLVSARLVPLGWAPATYVSLNAGLVTAGLLFGTWLNELVLPSHGA